MKAKFLLGVLSILLANVASATVIKQEDQAAQIVQLGSVGVKSLGLYKGQTVVQSAGAPKFEPRQSANFAGKVVVSHDVTAGNVFYLNGLSVGALTAGMTSTSTTDLANYYVESPVGTILLTGHLVGVSGVAKPDIYEFSEPLFFSGGSTVRVVCIPSTTNAVECNANLIGYER